MTAKLHTQDRAVVVPGEILATGLEYLPSKGTYRQDDAIRANRIGLVQIDGKVIKTIPLAGRYLPKKGDTVIGRISDVLMSGWRVDLHTMVDAVLGLKEATNEYIKRGEDLTRYFALDDWVSAKVVQVTSQNLVDVSVRGPGLHKLTGGTIIHVDAQKVPRIIGARGSMVRMLKKGCDCDITVGQNGVIWIKGAPAKEVLAIQTIRLIEKNSHLPGLTEEIKSLLEELTGKEVE
ncbi:MAG: exosome complex RNA-binding protein Rrp4 [Candidatus Woesearchaeota archaeon]